MVGGKTGRCQKLAGLGFDPTKDVSRHQVSQADGLNCQDIESDFKGTARRNTYGNPQSGARYSAMLFSLNCLPPTTCGKLPGTIARRK